MQETGMKKQTIRQFTHQAKTYEYELHLGGVKRLNLRIRPDGTIRVSAPRLTSHRTIDDFLSLYGDKIEAAVVRAQARQRNDAPTLTKAQQAAQKEWLLAIIRECHQNLVLPRFDALDLVLTERQRRFILSPTAIRIRVMKTRWGSCSSKGNLNFNCLLMLAPPEVLDSVVVHELCHRKHMNHSAAFYAEIDRVFPDYKIHHAWLKKNGRALMNRVK